MNKTFSIAVSPKGEITHIYRDDLKDLLNQGRSKTVRASRVEPLEDNTWEADLELSGGPKFIGQTRQEALDLELNWLENKLRT